MRERRYPYLTDWPEGFLDDVADFLDADASRPRGQDLYPEVFTAGSFYPLQRQRELAAMMRAARPFAPRVVMEIGADKGGSLYHWVKCHPGVTRAVGCEIRGTPYAELFEKAFPGVDFLWINESSLLPGTVARVADWLGPDRFDCIFLDGDKSYFLEDFKLYAPLVKRPGAVFMHDIRDSPTKEAFEAARGLGSRWAKIIDTTEGEEAEARRGEPEAGPYEQWLRYWGTRSCGVGVVYLD